MSVIHQQTFLGEKMTQLWQELPIWEEFFNQYPVQTMIELGTGNGGMALFFALQCYQRHIYFHTFDNNKFFNFDAGVPALLNMLSVFHFVDLFSDEGRAQVKHLIDNLPHPMVIFFDDGDKPREWKQFADLLSPGDFCVVHDWDREFFEKDIGDVKVESILLEEREERKTNWMTRFFARK